VTSSRLSIWLLCAGAVALACGPQARSAASPDSAGVSPAPAPQDGSPIASSLDVAVSGDVRLTLHVTNTSDQPLELRFASGQTHDFAIVDSTGREMWRWSAGRMFTQALQTRILASGQSIHYEERWTPAGAEGELTVIAQLTSTSHSVTKRVEFTLP
jgi:hypothetical protein